MLSNLATFPHKQRVGLLGILLKEQVEKVLFPFKSFILNIDKSLTVPFIVDSKVVSLVGSFLFG